MQQRKYYDTFSELMNTLPEFMAAYGLEPPRDAEAARLGEQYRREALSPVPAPHPIRNGVAYPGLGYGDNVDPRALPQKLKDQSRMPKTYGRAFQPPIAGSRKLYTERVPQEGSQMKGSAYQLPPIAGALPGEVAHDFGYLGLERLLSGPNGPNPELAGGQPPKPGQGPVPPVPPVIPPPVQAAMPSIPEHPLYGGAPETPSISGGQSPFSALSNILGLLQVPEAPTISPPNAPSPPPIRPVDSKLLELMFMQRAGASPILANFLR